MATVFWTRLSNSLFVNRLPKHGTATVNAPPQKDFKNFAFREDIGIGRSWAEYSDDDGDALMLGDFSHSDMGLVDAIISCSGGSDFSQSSWLEQLMFPSLLARLNRLDESVCKLEKNVVIMHHEGPATVTDNDNDNDDNDSDSDSDNDSKMPYQLRFLKKIG